jgi:hypothetical protein
MVRHYREQSDGLEVAPAILLGLYCAVRMLCVWSVRPSSAYAPFKSQNDCDLCAIASIERCTAADPLGRSRSAGTGNDRHQGAGRNDVQKPNRQLSRNVPDASAKPLIARSSAARRWTMPRNRSSGASDHGSSEIWICVLLRGTKPKMP